MKSYLLFRTLIVLLFIMLSGCSPQNDRVQPGTPVHVDYTCRSNDGRLVETTIAKIAGNETFAQSPIFTLRDTYTPFFFRAPKPATEATTVPYAPLEQKIGTAIANNAAALRLGKTTQMLLFSKEISELTQLERYLSMARTFTLERMQELNVAEFEARYGTVPRTVGSKVGEGTSTPGIIRASTERTVTVYYSARPEAVMPTVLGLQAVREQDADFFVVNMQAQAGQLVPRVGGLPGKVTAVDDELFTIDFGQTFAGETLSCAVTAQLSQPDRGTQHRKTQWIGDYQQGLSQARRHNKHVLLLLTGRDCMDCMTMESKLLNDPSLQEQIDEFVLVKINVQQYQEIAERFGHQGTPLTLVLDGTGKELGRISGVQHIATIAYRLDQILAKGNKG